MKSVVLTLTAVAAVMFTGSNAFAGKIFGARNTCSTGNCAEVVVVKPAPVKVVKVVPVEVKEVKVVKTVEVKTVEVQAVEICCEPRRRLLGRRHEVLLVPVAEATPTTKGAATK